jgi:hypothetical protein
MADESGATSAPTGRSVEPASFRDPDSSVFYADGKVLRGFSERVVPDWDRLETSSFFPELVSQGKVVATTPLADASRARFLSPRGEPWAKVVAHERIPVVTYPYEWPFAMLRAAAELHLDVLLAALEESTSMKDGTAYNVQFVGARPTFVDIGSFEPANGPWPGYRQFCQTMLFPLLLQAHLGVPYHALLRGSLDGLSAAELSGMFSGRKRFKKGVFKNVTLHGALERRVDASSEQVKQNASKAGYNVDLVKAVARNLRKLVRKLEVGKRASTWSDYRTTCSYSDADAEAKQGFVRAVVTDASPTTVLDLGANDGVYSRIAAEQAAHVVAVDGDEAVVDRLYRQLHAEGNEQILPLTINLVDPPGGLGWRNEERAAFSERVRPDLTMALALVHHLAIAANVPLPQVVEWLASFGPSGPGAGEGTLLVEFVHRDDPMVKRLLSNKPEGLFDDYQLATFESLLKERCHIERSEVLPGGTRTLFLARPR